MNVGLPDQSAAVVAVTIDVRSRLPGRERWTVPALRHRPRLAEAFATRLQSIAGVEHVTVNQQIGSALVEFAPAALSAGRDALLTLARQVVAELLPLQTTPNRPIAAAQAPAMLPVAAPALAALALLLPLPVIAVAGAVGASALILGHYFDKARAVRGNGSELPGRRHPAVRLIDVVPGLRRRIAGAAFLSAAGKILNITPPLLLGWSVRLLTTGSLPLLARLGIAATSTQLVVLAAAGVVLWATEAALEYQAARVWRAIAGTVQQELRIQGYDAVQNADFSVLDEQRIGGLANILNDDVAQIEVFLKSSANDVVQLMMNVAIVGPLFYYVAPSLLYIAVLPIPFLIWVSFGFIDRSTEPHARTREHAAALNNQLVTNLSGVAVIRSFATEDHELAHIRQLSSDYQTSSSVTDHQAAALSPSIRLIMVSTWASQIVIGGFGVLRGQLLPGSYITLVSLTQKFLWPLIMLGRAVDDYQRAMASATRVFTLIDLPRGGEGAKGSILPPAPAGGASVAFDHVSFAYPGRPPVLDDVSMKILPGGVVAIVGPTGSGKSTVIKLLLRFYDAEAGRILYNGVDIRSLEAGALRRSISLVSQDAFLFAGTIGENIRYGSFDATSEAVSAAARLAEIERFIGSLPDGYDTVIGDNGLKLSGGQRQRLCLARAILKDAPLLILDEATSAVDYETEIAIQRALHTIKATRTMIVIAHRLTTIRNADRIYVLDGGIVEQGTHDELIARGKTYASLWALQSGLPTDEDMEMTH